MKVLVIGGGPGGFSAAMVARKVGAEVTLVERTNMLGGLGLVAGIAVSGATPIVFAEEKALGGADLADVFAAIVVREGLIIPGIGDAVTTYTLTKLDARMQRALREAGVTILLHKMAAGMEMSDDKIKAVTFRDGTQVEGDAFVDATGAVEGLRACEKLGRGCVVHLPVSDLRQPGGLVEKRSATVSRLNAYGTPGVFGVSVLIPVSSLSAGLQREIADRGFTLIPIPPGAVMDEDRMKRSGAPERFKKAVHKENIILVDVGGYVKIVASGSPMWAGSIRSFPGLEDASIAQPLAGQIGHLVMATTIALRDNTLKADGFGNLFCAGAKAGPTVSLKSAIIAGDLAGYNAARYAAGKTPLELPKALITGAFIDLTGRMTRAPDGLRRGYGIEEPDILRDLKVYTGDKQAVVEAVERAGLTGIYRTKLI